MFVQQKVVNVCVCFLFYVIREIGFLSTTTDVAGVKRGRMKNDGISNVHDIHTYRCISGVYSPFSQKASLSFPALPLHNYAHPLVLKPLPITP